MPQPPGIIGVLVEWSLRGAADLSLRLFHVEHLSSKWPPAGDTQHPALSHLSAVGTLLRRSGPKKNSG